LPARLFPSPRVPCGLSPKRCPGLFRALAQGPAGFALPAAEEEGGAAAQEPAGVQAAARVRVRVRVRVEWRLLPQFQVPYPALRRWGSYRPPITPPAPDLDCWAKR